MTTLNILLAIGFVWLTVLTLAVVLIRGGHPAPAPPLSAEACEALRAELRAEVRKRLEARLGAADDPRTQLKARVAARMAQVQTPTTR